jgi:3-phenylpropionate/cinnamic acid dioxygenase small subunit
MRNAALGAIAGIFVTAVVAVFSAPPSDADVLRETRDRVEIEDLMWRYARALDTNDPDGYAAMYTPDGQFVAGANATKGHDALRKMIADLRQRATEARAKGEPRPPMYHMTANERITFSDTDHARIEAYYITATAAAGANTPLRVVGVGRSVDDLVRVNGRWLIRTRNVAPQD